jgi:Trypsin
MKRTAFGLLLFVGALLPGPAVARLPDPSTVEDIPCEKTLSTAFNPDFAGFLADFSGHFALPAQPGPLAQTAGIYGQDNRVPMHTGYPWSAIGRFQIKGLGDCTATLISACHLLTAGHCVADKDNAQDYPLKKLSFSASNGGPAAKVQKTLHGEFAKNRAEDWGVVKLDKSIGKQTGWFGLLNVDGPSISEKEPLILPGYSKDVGDGGKIPTVDDHVWKRTQDSQNRLTDADGKGNLLFIQVNSGSGSSGGPLFRFNDKSLPYISGVNTRGLFWNNGAQIQFSGDAHDPMELGNGVASAQFYDKVKEFLRQNPCD